MERPKKNICDCGGKLILHKSTFEQYDPSSVRCNKCTVEYSVSDNNFRNAMIEDYDNWLEWVMERLKEVNDEATEVPSLYNVENLWQAIQETLKRYGGEK